jgi:predicted heme/steroid binding protein
MMDCGRSNVIDNQLVKQQIQASFSEVQYLIRLLYATQDVHMKNLTLNQLWNKIAQLQFLIQLKESAPIQPQPAVTMQPLQMPAGLPSAVMQPIPVQQPVMQPSQPIQNGRTFTREQLLYFNGKNGRPAYVAVGGVVYDVTNNAAWSAATHFGLTAGNDWTREFASCHAAEQWILNTLTPVGRLVN